MRIFDRLYRLPAILRYRASTLLDKLERQRGDQGQMTHFRCNVCGRRSSVGETRLNRELVSCVRGSSVRQRALIHVLSLELFGESLALPDFPHRTNLIGIDMSGAATYAEGLARKLGYTNTYLHRSPRLDITNPAPDWLGHCDFVISSDVFEHVAPPVGRAFDNTLSVLKPGGLFVLTVPYAKAGDNIEHFPELHDWHIEELDGRRILKNMTADGRSQQFDNLIFHGGEGETLEMRVFSETGVLGELRRAGFTDILIHDEPCMAHGIIWPQNWSLPISARRPSGAG